jgi:hypothetical protein
VYLSFDQVDQCGLLLDETQEQGVQLLPIQPGQEPWQRRPLLDLRRVMHAGQQGRDDMLAPAAPVVGASAARLGDAPRIAGDVHRVRLDLAILHLGLKL